VTSLGEIGGAAAAHALHDALSQPDDQVRAAAATALGGLRSDPTVLSTEARLLRADPSYAVQAAAATAIGHSGSPAAFDVLSSRIDPAWDEHLVEAILDAIAATRDPRAAALLFKWGAPGIQERERDTALAALASSRIGLSDDQKRQLILVVRAAQHDPVQSTRGAGAQLAAVYGLGLSEAELRYPPSR
jgi:HEAT repeat protein